MAWNDDSWRDGYDDWKLASPYDDDPECDHDDYEVDILDGRCRCTCGHAWHATNAQVEAEIEHQRAYDEWEHGENRRQWWRDRWESVKSLFRWRRPKHQFVSDDDIPF